jgi:hypothetical protein
MRDIGRPGDMRDMLVNLSKKVGACYERAAVCRRVAERASGAEAAGAFLRIEQSWLNLARSFEQADSLPGTVQHATGPLTFRCPQTGREVSAGIETSYEALAGSWASIVNVHCEHCARPHPVPVRDGYIRTPKVGPADPRYSHFRST